jgi:hypothetical protein
MIIWQKVGRFYRRKGYGRDDLIYNNMVKIVYDKDLSPWAFECFEACAELLHGRNRWPQWMDEPTDCKSIIGWWMYGRLQRIEWWLWDHNVGIKLIYHKRTRYRKDMTRDPYIAFYRCAVHLNRVQFVETIKMPIRLWRPEVWKWKRRLLKEHRLNYVQRLRHLRAGAIYELGEREGIYDKFCGVYEE